MRAWLLIFMAAALASPAQSNTADGVAAWERRDYKTALEQWRKAADKGDTDARFNLGQAFRLGWGVPVDAKKAEDFYRQAADQGHVQAADNYGLAMFRNGQPRAAIPFLERAAARGDPRAQYVLGTMLFNGTDIKKDWPRAYALLSRSAKGGVSQAEKSLAQMDKYVSADQRRQGLALADRMAPASPAREVAGGRAPSVARVTAPPPIAATPSPRPVSAQPAAPVPVSTGGGWRLQLGAFGDPGNARQLGLQLGGRFPGRTVDYEPVGALTRVLVGPYVSRAAAQAACGSVKPCVPVEP